MGCFLNSESSTAFKVYLQYELELGTGAEAAGMGIMSDLNCCEFAYCWPIGAWFCCDGAWPNRPLGT